MILEVSLSCEGSTDLKDVHYKPRKTNEGNLKGGSIFNPNTDPWECYIYTYIDPIKNQLNVGK